MITKGIVRKIQPQQFADEGEVFDKKLKVDKAKPVSVWTRILETTAYYILPACYILFITIQTICVI